MRLGHEKANRRERMLQSLWNNPARKKRGSRKQRFKSFLDRKAQFMARFTRKTAESA
jgi:hypothetical protein